MKLVRLFLENLGGDLIEDPNWLIYLGSMPLRTPVNYQDTKQRLKEEIDRLNFEGDKGLFEEINNCKLWANIDIMDYPQYFNVPVGDFHVDDEFSLASNRTDRYVIVNNEGLKVRISRGYQRHSDDTGEGKLISPEIVSKLIKMREDNKMIILQAFDSYLRDKGQSIAQFDPKLKYFPVYGM